MCNPPNSVASEAGRSLAPTLARSTVMALLASSLAVPTRGLAANWLEERRHCNCHWRPSPSAQQPGHRGLRGERSSPAIGWLPGVAVGDAEEGLARSLSVGASLSVRLCRSLVAVEWV